MQGALKASRHSPSLARNTSGLVFHRPSLPRSRRRSVVITSSPRSKDHFPKDEGLPLSLFTPYSSLPPDGKTIPLKDEMCDPEQDKCKTPTYVYEAPCRLCSSTGSVRSLANGRRGSMSTCPTCHGLGYVRRTTARFSVHVDGTGPNLTVNRPTDDKSQKSQK